MLKLQQAYYDDGTDKSFPPEGFILVYTHGLPLRTSSILIFPPLFCFSIVPPMSEAIKLYGWAAKPRDPAVFLEGKKKFKDPVPQHVESIKLPDTPIAKAVLEYARKELNVETFNHSMRVFYYGKLPSIVNNQQS